MWQPQSKAIPGATNAVLHTGLLGGCFPKKWPLPPSAPTTVFNLVSNIIPLDCMICISFPCIYWHSACYVQSITEYWIIDNANFEVNMATTWLQAIRDEWWSQKCIAYFCKHMDNIASRGFPLLGRDVNTDEFHLRNDLYCVEWGVKLYSLTHCSVTVPYIDALLRKIKAIYFAILSR